jgi:hypothetical protein
VAERELVVADDRQHEGFAQQGWRHVEYGYRHALRTPNIATLAEQSGRRYVRVFSRDECPDHGEQFRFDGDVEMQGIDDPGQS